VRSVCRRLRAGGEARQPLGLVVVGGLLFSQLVTLFLTPLLFFLPKATLAATIVVAVLSLVDFSALKKTWNYSRADFAAMAARVRARCAVFGKPHGYAYAEPFDRIVPLS